MGDGSLGDPSTRLACTLLSPGQIELRFDGPVAEPTPTYPFCQWQVGDDGFVAVRVYPNTPIESIRQGTRVVQEVADLGDGAFFSNSRYLYFGRGDASYWVLYQRAGEFTGTREEDLIGLGHTILSLPLPGTPSPLRTQIISTTGPTDPAVALPSPTPDDPLGVWFGGDSLSAGPSWAFLLDVADDPTISPTLEYQVGTGTVRDDFFDWYTHLAGVVAGLDPRVVVFMVGANDNQAFRTGQQVVAPSDPAWETEYRRRVGLTMDLLAADGRRVLWIGMPPMENPGLSEGMARVNAAFQAEAETRPGLMYIDAWAMFAGPRAATPTTSRTRTATWRRSDLTRVST